MLDARFVRGAVGFGEIDRDPERALYAVEMREFRAVIRGDGVEFAPLRQPLEAAIHRAGEGLGPLARREGHQERVARLPLHEGADGLVPIRAEDEVHFEVAHTGFPTDALGAVGNGFPPGPMGLWPVGEPALPVFERVAGVRVEVAPIRLILVEIGVDGGFPHEGRPEPPVVPGDLLGRPLLRLDRAPDSRLDARGELAGLGESRPAYLGDFLRDGRAVLPPFAVAFQLAGDGALMHVNGLGYLGNG